MTLVNSAYETAIELKQLLKGTEAGARPFRTDGEKYQFFVSDLADKFTSFATAILPNEVKSTQKINIEEVLVLPEDVSISIRGAQIQEANQEQVELITTGDYFLKNGKHYILYDEVSEGNEGIIRNTIKVLPESMNIIKRGAISTDMLFEKNQKK